MNYDDDVKRRLKIDIFMMSIRTLASVGASGPLSHVT